MAKQSLRVCLVAPLPPPYGGISHWARTVIGRAQSREDVSFNVVNTSPRWRAIHDLSTWKRVAGGGLQLLRDLGFFFWILIWDRPAVVHLTTAGSMAIVRDMVFAAIAKLMGAPVVYHLHYGRASVEAARKSREWMWLCRVMRCVHTVVPIDRESENAIRENLPNVRVKRVPNCIDPDAMPTLIPDANSTHTAIFLGWVVPTKGVLELVEAWNGMRLDDW